MKVQSNYCNNNLLILNVKTIKKIMKVYYFYILKALWDGQGKFKMYYGMSRVKKQLPGKRSITLLTNQQIFIQISMFFQPNVQFILCYFLPVNHEIFLNKFNVYILSNFFHKKICRKNTILLQIIFPNYHYET